MSRNNCRLLLTVVLPALLAILAAGCSSAARHEVLTFFFTGVPPMDGGSPKAAAVDSALPKMSLYERRLADRDRIAALRPFTGPYVHGPFAAQSCEQCHEMAAGGFGFGNIASQTKMNIVPGRFVLPPAELCVACHAGKSNAAAQAAGLRLHGPAENCLICHQPHNGKAPYFLKMNVGELCRQCHGDGYIHDADLHTEVEDCLECHNPHLGRDAAMLRDDYQETF